MIQAASSNKLDPQCQDHIVAMFAEFLEKALLQFADQEHILNFLTEFKISMDSGVLDDFPCLLEAMSSVRIRACRHPDLLIATNALLNFVSLKVKESKNKILEQIEMASRPRKRLRGPLDDFIEFAQGPKKRAAKQEPISINLVDCQEECQSATELKQLKEIHHRSINPLEIKKTGPIGSGQFAQVYKGIWKGSPVAIKEFNMKTQDTQFWNEVSLLCSLRHPGLVQYFGYSIDPTMRIFMELMDQGSLFELLHYRKRTITSFQRIAMACKVCSTMTFLHSSRVIHCDLNSKNLLVAGEMDIKVADLGLAVRIQESQSRTPAKQVGTLRWMSPEMFARKCFSLEKCDVWSFGIVLFELGSRCIPYWDKTDADVKMELRKGGLPEAQDLSVWKGIPKEYFRIWTSCCTLNALERPNFEQLNKQLKELLDGTKELT